MESNQTLNLLSQPITWAGVLREDNACIVAAELAACCTLSGNGQLIYPRKITLEGVEMVTGTDGRIISLAIMLSGISQLENAGIVRYKIGEVILLPKFQQLVAQLLASRSGQR